jgi:galactose oxidase-like protein
MHRLAPFNLALKVACTMSLFAMTSCGEDTPTQPSTTLGPAHTSPSLATTSNSWSPIAPQDGPMGFGAVVGVVPTSAGPSKAYGFGGTNGYGATGVGIRIYNVATNTWTGPKDPYKSQVYVYSANGVGNIGDKLYFTGGYTEHDSPYKSADTWEYNPATDVLTKKADIPLHTADGVTGVIGDRLYVLPATCADFLYPSPGYCAQEDTRQLFRYNPATNVWVTRPAAPHVHRNGVGGVINGKFYVAGGESSQNSGGSTNLDVYDPATNKWTTLAPLPTNLRGIVGTVLQGQLFVTGGTSSGSIRHYAYNPTSNKWNAKAAPTTTFWGGAAVKVYLNGTSRMLVISGPTVDDPDESQMYTP